MYIILYVRGGTRDIREGIAVHPCDILLSDLSDCCNNIREYTSYYYAVLRPTIAGNRTLKFAENIIYVGTRS